MADITPSQADDVSEVRLPNRLPDFKSEESALELAQAVGADADLTQLPRFHLPSLIPREPFSVLDFCRLELGQSCVGTWGNSASAPTL